MNHVRTAAAASFLVLAAGCHHRVLRDHPTQTPADVRYSDPGATQQPTSTPAPQPTSNRPTPGQVIVDALTAKGYTCTPTEDQKWSCTNASLANWPFFVSWAKEDAQTTVRFDSLVQRAFAHKCAEFKNHMDDLSVADDFYAISCDDSTQRFTFDTAIKFTADVNAEGWAKNHVQNRERSQLLLSKTGASVELHTKP